jgi:hypothetical protein
MEYTLSGAAKATGRGKSTLHRAIKSGKLSAKRTQEGAYLIDAAELARAFPVKPPEPSPWDDAGRNDRPLERPGTETAVLQVRVEMLESQLVRERETVDDLRKRLDRAEERVLALTTVPREQPRTVPSHAPRGLLARLFGLGSSPAGT